MKTKYIKVNVADRLPEKDGEYYTEQGLLSFSKGSFCQYEGRAFVKSNNGVDNWLEPVPDREEEVKAMLKELLRFKNEIKTVMSKKLQYPDNFLNAVEKAEQLLIELQNKP